MHADSVPLEATTCTHRDKFCLDVGAIVITGSARGKLVSALVAMVLPGSHLANSTSARVAIGAAFVAYVVSPLWL